VALGVLVDRQLLQSGVGYLDRLAALIVDADRDSASPSVAA